MKSQRPHKKKSALTIQTSTTTIHSPLCLLQHHKLHRTDKNNLHTYSDPPDISSHIHNTFILKIHLNVLNVAFWRLAVPFIIRRMSVWFTAGRFVLSVCKGIVWSSTRYGVPRLKSPSVHLHDHPLTSLQTKFLLLGTGYLHVPRQGNLCFLITVSIKSKHCTLSWVKWPVLKLRIPFFYNPFQSLQSWWS